MNDPSVAKLIHDTQIYLSNPKDFNRGDLPELDAKLATLQGLHNVLQRNLDKLKLIKSPDKITAYRLTKALESNEELTAVLQQTIQNLRGNAADKLAFDAQLAQYAQQISQLQALLDQRGRETEQKEVEVAKRISLLDQEKQSQAQAIAQKEVELQRFQAEHPTLVSQIAQLQQQLEALKASHSVELAQKNVEIKSLHQSVSDLQAQLQSLTSDKQALEQRFQHLQAEKVSADANIQTMLYEKRQSDLSRAQVESKLQSQVAAQQSELEKIRLQFQKEVAEKEAIQEQVNQLNVKKIQNEQEAKQVSQKSEEIQAKVEQLSTKSSEYELHIQQLNSKVDQLQLAKSTLSDQYEALSKQSVEKDQRLEALSSQLESGRDQLATLRKAQEKVLAEKQELNAQLASVQLDKGVVEKDLASLSAQLVASQQSIQSQQARVTIAENSLASVEAKNKELSEKITQLQASVDSGAVNNSSLLALLQSNKSEQEQQLTEVRAQLDKFKAAVAEKETAAGILTTQVAEKEKQYQEMSSTVSSLLDQLKSKDASHSTLVAENVKLVAENKSLSTKMELLTSQLNEISQKQDRLDTENSSLKEKITTLTESSAQASLDKSSLERKVNELELGIDRCNTSKEQFAKAMVELEDELRVARESLKNASVKTTAVDTKQQEVDTVRAQLATLIQQNKESSAIDQKQIQDLTNINNQYSLQLVSTKKELDDVLSSLKTVKAGLESTVTQLNSMTLDRNQFQKTLILERAQHTEQIKKIQTDLTQSQRTMEEFKAKSISLEQTIASSLLEKEDLSKQLALFRKAKEECDALVASLQSTIAQLTQQLNEIQSQSDGEKGYKLKFEQLNAQISSAQSAHAQEIAQFRRTIEETNQKLGLSEIKVAQLEQAVAQSTSKNISLEKIQEQIFQKESVIRDLTGQIQLEKSQQQILNGKLQADLQTALSSASSLEAQVSDQRSKDAVLQQQKDSLERALESVKLSQQTVEQQLGQEKSQRQLLSERLQEVTEQNKKAMSDLLEYTSKLQVAQEEIQAKETLIQSLQKGLANLPEKNEQPAPEEPKPAQAADVSELLVKQVDQDRIIVILDKQLDELQKAVQDSLATYLSLTKSLVTMPFDLKKINFGGASIRSYALSMVLLFHTWKTILRIPILMRSEIGSDYLYPLPEQVESSTLFSIVPSELQDAFRTKIADNKMRIDIILYFLIAGLVQRKDDLNNNSVEFKDVFNYMIGLIQYTTKNLYEVMNKIKKMTGELSNEIKQRHNKQPSRILTFIRLSSATPKETSDRFKWNVIDQNAMNIQYSDQPIAFYNEIKDPTGKITLEWKRNAERMVYPSNYWFGPFTKVYLPTDTNRMIAEDRIFRQQIEKRLRNLEPVCIIGYGASGSGKTTTLVYASYTTIERGVSKSVNENGILLLLADQLSKNVAIDGVSYTGFTECQVALYELEADTDSSNPAEKAICHKYPEDKENPLTATRSLITKDKEADNYTRKFVEGPVQYDKCTPDAVSRYSYKIGTTGTWVDSQNKGMEDKILDGIDRTRSIASTENNNQSSRSHIICVLTFLNTATGQLTTLIVCDFAGVENKFNCNNPIALDKIGVPTLVEIEKKKIIQKAVVSIQNPEIQNSVSAGKLLTDVTNIPVLSVDTYNNLAGYCKRITDVFSKQVSMKVVKPIKENNFSTYLSWFPDGDDKRALTTKKEVPLDISVLTDYNLIRTDVDARKSFPKDSYLKIYSSFLNDPSNKKIYQTLVKLYGGFTKDLKTNTTDPLIPELVKLVVWFKNSFNAYDLLYHSLLTLTVNSEAKSLSTLEDIQKAIKLNLCDTRVKEGMFINNSLKKLREFISDTLRQSVSTGFAPFTDQCAAIQCNPYYRDCYGQNQYVSVASSGVPNPSNYGDLAKYIMNVPHSDKMTFCIMNVLNLSKQANNPPPTPYIDITDLMIEKERMNTYLSKGVEEDEYALMLSQKKVSPDVLNRIIRSPLLDKMSDEFKNLVKSLVADLLNGTGQPMDKLEYLIQTFVNSNAITAIGTMDFTDSMAKYGNTVTTCNLSV